MEFFCGEGGERMEFLDNGSGIGRVLSVDEYCREGGDFVDWELEREREEPMKEGLKEELLKAVGWGRGMGWGRLGCV
jgi:hypothetical protein